MSRAHSRNASEETTSSATSYQLVLEHLLQYPGSYEIPLRTMYTLNCAPRAQPLPRQWSRAPTPTSSSSNTSPISGQFNWSDAGSAAANFTSALMNQISSLPSQPCSLPPNFIVSFVSRCFHPQLVMVDFPQALTALDYLKDLETRRRRDFAAAFHRLNIQPDTVGTPSDEVSRRYPGVALWAKNIAGKGKKAEGYYTQLYLGLRRWVMINELSLQPFNKHNCVGMLNTLFPPQPPVQNARQPTNLLTAEVLAGQREGFFTYIKQVEKRGPSVLKNIIDQGKLEGDENGWGAMQQVLDKYLRVAKNMIDDCSDIVATGTDNFKLVDEAGKRKGKKTDSGVSFGSDQRPSTSNSTHEKPLPPAPAEYKNPNKGLSTIERITREFKRMRVKTRPDVEEIIKYEKQSPLQDITDSGNEKPKPKTLKKAKSMAALGNIKDHNGSSTSLTSSRKASDATYDPREMKNYRAMYDSPTTPRRLKDSA